MNQIVLAFLSGCLDFGRLSYLRIKHLLFAKMPHDFFIFCKCFVAWLNYKGAHHFVCFLFFLSVFLLISCYS